MVVQGARFPGQGEPAGNSLLFNARPVLSAVCCSSAQRSPKKLDPQMPPNVRAQGPLT